MTLETIKEKVTTQITSGHAQMRPRWYFAVRSIAFGLVCVVVLLSIVHVLSFMVFTLKTSGAWFMPAFGRSGWGELIMSVPWMLVLLAIIFMVLLEGLLRHYAIGYRQPLVYSAMLVVAVVVVGSVIVSTTSLHHRLFERAEANHLPIGGMMYRAYGAQRLEHVHPGTIVSFVAQGFTLQPPRGTVVMVRVSPDTIFPIGSDFDAGDWVVVFGDREADTINARGIRPMEPPRFQKFRALYGR
jgi:hypothetical protein